MSSGCGSSPGSLQDVGIDDDLEGYHREAREMAGTPDSGFDVRILDECQICSKLRFIAPNIKCVKCENVVGEDKVYYRDKNEEWRNICESCYAAEKGKYFNFREEGYEKEGEEAEADDDDVQVLDVVLPKENFLRKVNRATESEPMVKCFYCGDYFHKICIGFVKDKSMGPRDDVVCDDCVTSKSPQFGCENPEAIFNQERFGERFRCENLPHTDLSEFLERRLCRLAGKLQANKVHVRVLSSVPKIFRLPDKLTKFLAQHNVFSRDLPYRSRVLCCFQDVEDGGSVLFFAAYFQEYGPDCPAPNTNSIYIEMIDSSQLFEPKEKRRMVHQSILLGYFAYVRRIGFKKVFLWSCPPTNTEKEYIFYRRPDPTKILFQKNLNAWYKNVMEVGMQMLILDVFSTLSTYAPKRSLPKFIENFPYFFGDHWAGAVINIIDAAEKGQLSRSRQGKSAKRKRYSGTSEELKSELIYREVIRQLGEYRNRESFFYMQLLVDEDRPLANPPDFNIDIFSPLMSDRGSLVNFFRDNGLEFKDKWKATYGTKALIAELMQDPNFCEFLNGNPPAPENAPIMRINVKEEDDPPETVENPESIQNAPIRMTCVKEEDPFETVGNLESVLMTCNLKDEDPPETLENELENAPAPMEFDFCRIKDEDDWMDCE